MHLFLYSVIQHMFIKHRLYFKPHFKAGHLKMKESQSLLLEHLERSMLFEGRSYIGVEARLGKEPR